MRIKIILLSLAFTLTSCQRSNKTEQYLGCYALDPSSKQECVDRLAKKYISEGKRKDEQYIKSFQYEHEKLGFKEFLNNKNLPCENVIKSVLFDDEHQAYRVKCQPNSEYFMRFDYRIKAWQLIKKNI